MNAPTIRQAKLRNPSSTPTSTRLSVSSRGPVPKIPEPLPEISKNQSSVFPRLIITACLGLAVVQGFRVLTGLQTGQVTDRIVAQAAQAMAPAQIVPGSMVQTRPEIAQIRGGPGIEFPVTGALETGSHYMVLSEQGSWYRLQIDQATPAWVASDTVILAKDP